MQRSMERLKNQILQTQPLDVGSEFADAVDILAL